MESTSPVCFQQSPVTVSEDEETFDEEIELQCSLRIMIINPNKKREYVMVKADKMATGMTTFSEVKQLVLDSFPASIPQPEIDQLQFSYIEPGHGLKGKKSGFWTTKI